VAALRREHQIECTVQPSSVRIFPDAEYEAAGAVVDDDLSACPVILAVKEIPPDLLLPGATYLFFSHTVKGQAHNMPMLRRLLELGCQLIDYERIADDTGRRLVFFGRHAGLAGMIDTLWTLGRRLRAEGFSTPLSGILPAHTYPDLETARAAVTAAGNRIREQGFPAPLGPMVIGFAGYGNVSAGAQEIFDLLPHRTVEPDRLDSLPEEGQVPFTKVVFKEEHLVEPVAPGAAFDLEDYYARPEGYRSVFARRYLPWLTVLVNCIYWEPRYPRLVTRADCARLEEASSGLRLRVVGDITCDVEGSVECTVKATGQDQPVYTYDPATDRVTDDILAHGVAILAVDNLPCELPHAASTAFGEMLMPLLPALARTDFGRDFADVDLPDPLRRATIVHRGQLTEEYRYLAECL
jgi:alpha-aminoadipic semialdehyde synthase